MVNELRESNTQLNVKSLTFKINIISILTQEILINKGKELSAYDEKLVKMKNAMGDNEKVINNN